MASEIIYLLFVLYYMFNQVFFFICLFYWFVFVHISVQNPFEAEVYYFAGGFIKSQKVYQDPSHVSGRKYLMGLAYF